MILTHVCESVDVTLTVILTHACEGVDVTLTMILTHVCESVDVNQMLGATYSDTWMNNVINCEIKNINTSMYSVW
jgi:hypothetical protein